MATYNVAPSWPGVSAVTAGVQGIARRSASVFDQAGLNRIGDVVKFMFIPTGNLGRSVVTSATGMTVTAVHNTSPLWMPVMMEATMGRPAAWVAISLFGIPNAPAHILIGAGVGSYILFTSSANAIRWAFQKKPEQIGELLNTLRRDVQVLRELVQLKENLLQDLNEKIEVSEESLQSAQNDLIEYSNGLNGKFSTNDAMTIEDGVRGTEGLIEATANYLALIRDQRVTVQEELDQVNEQLEEIIKSLQEAEAEVEQLNAADETQQI